MTAYSLLYLLVLLDSLGSPRFDTREAASKELTRLVVEYPHRYGAFVHSQVPRLVKAGSPEVSARLRPLIIAYHSNVAATYIPRSVPVWPLCDCWPYRVLGCDIRNKEFLRPDYRDYSAEDDRYNTFAATGPYYLRWRETTEMWIRTRIRAGLLSPAEADVLLARVWSVERRWRADCRYSTDASDTWDTLIRIVDANPGVFFGYPSKQLLENP